MATMSTKDSVVREMVIGVVGVCIISHIAIGVAIGVPRFGVAGIGVAGIEVEIVEVWAGVPAMYVVPSFRISTAGVCAAKLSGMAIMEGFILVRRTKMEGSSVLWGASPTALASDSFKENAQCAGAEAKGVGIPDGDAGKSMNVFFTNVGG